MFNPKYKKITDKDFKRNFGNTMHECLMHCFFIFSPFVFLFPAHFFIYSSTMITSDYNIFSPQAIINSFKLSYLIIDPCAIYALLVLGTMFVYCYCLLFQLLMIPYHFLIWHPFVSKEDILVITPENTVITIEGRIAGESFYEYGVGCIKWYYFHIKYKDCRLPNTGDLHKITKYLKIKS